MESVWSEISSWFKDVSNRKILVREFNNAAQKAYINGFVPYLLKCSISRGYKPYKHSNSFFFSGIRLIVLSNDKLLEKELNEIGLSILCNSKIVRLLITLGWDTLEVVCDKGKEGLHWKLTNFSES